MLGRPLSGHPLFFGPLALCLLFFVLWFLDFGSARAERPKKFQLSARLVLDWKWWPRPTRSLRGGSWINNDPRNLLSSYRNNNDAGNRNNNYGFRLVLVGAAVCKVFQTNGAIRRGEKALRRQSQEGMT